MFDIKRESGMLEKLPLLKPIALFLFAHQDDEFGVFQKILDEQKLGRQIFCAYLTDGVFQGQSSARRNLESTSVLTQLGVRKENIAFVGNALSIPDASLPNHLGKAINWLVKWLAEFETVTAIYLPAWEGGHHDHDALHAMGVMVLSKRGRLHLVKQYTLYNAYKCVSPFFRVLHPLVENGELEVTKIPWLNRIRFLRYCLSYPSQATTWLGLFPFALIYYLFSGKQVIQPVSLARIAERPHNGPLYYENRKFYTWEQMSDILTLVKVSRS